MKNRINEHLRRTYADHDHLTCQKAMAITWICLASILVVGAILWHDLYLGTASGLFYVLSLAPMLLVLALTMWATLRGSYLRWVDRIFALGIGVHLLDGALVVHEGLLRTFYQGYAVYGYALVLAAAVFVRRRVFHALALAELLSLPLFGLLLVPASSMPEFKAGYLPNIGDGIFSRLLVWGIAWAFIAIMDRALARVQHELDANRKLRENLEVMVEERTRELVAARHEAEGANRAKGVFLANVSHEIRTPIHGILGMTDLLLEEEADGAKAEKIRIVSDSGNHLLGIIQDILDYSRIEAGGLELHLQAMELAPFLRSLADPMGVLARAKGNELGLTVGEGTPAFVLADGLRLRQILTNLLANAIKFTQDGRVELEVRRDEGIGDFVFAVRDTGIGMDALALERIFERFRQADESIVHRYGGTGLGLSISRMLAELMGGTIGVESRKGHGSCFTVRIPLPSCPPPDALEPGARADAQAHPEEIRILLVDDNAVNRRIAETILAKHGCKVVAVDTAPKALEQLARDSFDLVLMDCNLPGMNGFEVTRALRAWKDGASLRMQAAARIPVVALTASSLEEIREAYLTSGMDEALLKPYHPKDLREVVERWSGRRHGELKSA